jgi:NADH-quinone oxidoreductase subunit N
MSNLFLNNFLEVLKFITNIFLQKMINEKKSLGLLSLISLQLFTVFPEYFISISIIYVLTVIFLITYSVYSLILQKAVSESIVLILFMACYLLINDDIIALNFLTFNNSIVNDYFGFFTKFIICVSSAFYFLLVGEVLKYQRITSFEYLLIILFAVLGLMLLCSSNDLLTAYLAIELSSLSCYVLAAFKKTSNYSIEGGIKYFVTGAVSSAFFLLGSSYIYGVSGTINFTDLNDLFSLTFTVASFDSFDYNFIELGLTLVLFSLFIKLALAPFYLWSLDVYEGSPTSSTVFFAVVTKLSIFVLLVRLCYLSFFDLSNDWQFYSLWIGVFSIFVGSFGGLRQRKLKTLLAYSSTSHMGYALIAFSTNTFEGIQMLLFYIVIYMISGLCVWSIILFLRPNRKMSLQKGNRELGDFVLLKNSNSILAFTFVLAMFSVAGIPPLIGFLAKMSIFLSVVGASFYAIALINILFSVVSTFYYIRIVKVLYFENFLVGKLYHPITTKKVSIIGFLMFLLIFLFAYPTILYLNSLKVVLSFL